MSEQPPDTGSVVSAVAHDLYAATLSMSQAHAIIRLLSALESWSRLDERAEVDRAELLGDSDRMRAYRLGLSDHVLAVWREVIPKLSP